MILILSVSRPPALPGDQMTKKWNDPKQKKVTVPHALSGEINRLLGVGNYYLVRTMARKILLNESRSEADTALAERALTITWPDTLALVVGLICLVVTTGTAFLVAY